MTLNLILIASSAMVVMAFISDILYQQKLAQYVSERPITLDLLFEYYGWYLIDSIPVFDVWSIFDIESPARSEGFLARFLLQVFLVLVVASGIETFRSKRGDFHYLLSLAKVLREGGETLFTKERALEMAHRHLDQAISLATREGIRMHQIDAHLEYAHLLIELGKKDRVGELLEKA